ncbi:MAG TPA: Gfo/Idh/MocA family oxidoreductase [Mycobacteriales bacterium]|nr:Gfo/Idh/MocA family oxidoreductase [Mycobacteriales bacterium]
MLNTLKIGLIGAGNAVHAHLAGFAELSISVAGICDLIPEKAESVAAQYGIARVYPHAGALIEAVEFVGVITPPDSHAELVIQALRADKDVTCEKPMGNNLSECDLMVEAETASDGRLFIVQNRAYTDAMKAMRKMIADGAVGTVLCIKSEGLEGEELLNRMPSIRTDERGVIGTQAEHQTYMGPLLVGSDIASVNINTHKRPDTNMLAPDGTADGTFTYANGVRHLLFHTLERGSLPSEHNLEIIGTEGKLRSFRTGPQNRRIEVLQWQRANSQIWENVDLTDARVRSREFAAMWADYLNAALTGSEPMMTTEMARRSIHIVDKMYESAALGGAPTAIALPSAPQAQPGGRKLGLRPKFLRKLGPSGPNLRQ